MLIIGQGALAREDGAAILAAAKEIADKYGLVSDEWNGFNVLHTAAARVGGLELGFVPGEDGMDTAAITNGDAEVVYLLGADEIDTSKLENSFVIYQGHNGDAGAQCADVILPGAAYTEKTVSTSTQKAAHNMVTKLYLHQVKQKKTGQSFVHFQKSSAKHCHMTA